MTPLRLLSDYLVLECPIESSDLIFVLAGLPERKHFGLDLYRRGVAGRIILSVGRYEVRHTASLIEKGNTLRWLARSTSPRHRHFFVDYQGDSCRITVAVVAGLGTYCELRAFADYISSEPVRTITLISTCIHLRRVHYCCCHIPFLADKKILYVPVPEAMSSFQRAGWWTRYRNWRYVIGEYSKLAGYSLLYRGAPGDSVCVPTSL